MAAAFDSVAFRAALAAFATGVTIVTARDGAGEPIGMTATSFNSVSLDPPLILWSVTKTARSAEAFRQAERFAVHVLGADQSALSSQFARSGSDKFAGVRWQAGAGEVPLLDGVAARFECRTWAVYEGGDHWIIVGEVLAIDSQPRETLLFARGNYATVGQGVQRSGEVRSLDGDAASPIDHLLLYHVSRLANDMTAELHRDVNAAGLTVAQWRLLASLYGGQPRPLRELLARTFLDHDRLVELISPLAQQGLLRMTAEEKLVITEAGSARVAPLFASAEKTAQRLRAEGRLEALKALL